MSDLEQVLPDIKTAHYHFGAFPYDEEKSVIVLLKEGTCPFVV